MADRMIAETVEWLLDAREPAERGWGLEYRKLPSVTVTSEVLLALKGAQAFIREPELLVSIEQALDAGLQFVHERLPHHRNPDLPNFAFALIAHLKIAAKPDLDFVRCCLEGIQLFRAGLGWKTKQQSERPNTFATCLAAIAFRELLEVHREAPVLDQASYEELYRAYYSTQSFLLTRPVRCLDGGWRESESGDEKSNPAVTALTLRVLAGFSDAGASSASVENEPLVEGTVEYLCSQTDAILTRWSYKLVDSDYNLFYIGYLVGALSIHLDKLGSTQLRFYYKAAELLASDRLRLRDSGGKFSGCSASPDPDPTPTVWATAHALAGLCSVPLPVRDLRQLVTLLRDGEELQRQLNNAESKAEELSRRLGTSGEHLPPEEYLSLGDASRGRLWIRLSRDLFALLVLLVLVFLAVLGRIASLLEVKLGVLATVFILSFLASFVVLNADSSERQRAVSYKILLSFLSAATVVGLVGIVLDLPVNVSFPGGS